MWHGFWADPGLRLCATLDSLGQNAGKGATGQGLAVRFFLRDNGKALVLGETGGLVKCASDAPDRLIGAPPIWGSNLEFDLLIQDMGKLKDAVETIAYWLGGVAHL